MTAIQVGREQFRWLQFIFTRYYKMILKMYLEDYFLGSVY